jgi:hypothetical protein
MPIHQRVLLAVVAALLGACGSSKQPDPPPVKDTAFGPAVGAMDKARGVNDTVMQQKEDTDRAISEQDGSSSQ